MDARYVSLWNKFLLKLKVDMFSAIIYLDYSTIISESECIQMPLWTLNNALINTTQEACMQDAV